MRRRPAFFCWRAPQNSMLKGTRIWLLPRTQANLTASNLVQSPHFSHKYPLHSWPLPSNSTAAPKTPRGKPESRALAHLGRALFAFQLRKHVCHRPPESKLIEPTPSSAPDRRLRWARLLPAQTPFVTDSPVLASSLKGRVRRSSMPWLLACLQRISRRISPKKLSCSRSRPTIGGFCASAASKRACTTKLSAKRPTRPRHFSQTRSSSTTSAVTRLRLRTRTIAQSNSYASCSGIASRRMASFRNQQKRHAAL